VSERDALADPDSDSAAPVDRNRVWCPPNTTWADYEDDSVVVHAKFHQLYWAFATAVVLFIIRLTLER
jgi:hypothetical protein